MKTIIVDSNVWLDIINRDENWFRWSAGKIESLGHDHQLVYDVIIYTELIPAFDSVRGLDQFLRGSPLERVHLPFSAAGPTSRAFMEYRKRGGAKSAPLPDFFIGGHAEAEGLTILTRDAKRYRTYFPTVAVISPEDEG